MGIEEVKSESAPEPIGPYSQAVIHGGLVFASGQIPLNPATGTIVEGGIEEQTRRVIANLTAVLGAAGSSLDRVLRTQIFLVDLAHFSQVNAIYAEFFTGRPAPARSTVQVAALPLGAMVEIDLIAVVE